MPATAALWVSWLLFVLISCGASHVASTVMLDRAPRAALGICLVAAALAALLYRLIRRRGDGSQSSPGEIPSSARIWTRVHSVALFGGFLLGVSPALVYNLTRPEYLIYSPWVQLLYANALGVLPFGVLLLALRLVLHVRCPGVLRMAGTRRNLWVACASVFAVNAAWASTAAICIAFLANFNAFESVRQRLSGTGRMTELHSVGLYRVDRVGDTYDICGNGPYFVVEMCDDAGSRDSCFAGSGGAGFYYTPPGTPDSCFNIGGDGALPGGWRWYVAD